MPWALERSGILEAAVQTTGLEDVLFRVLEQANEALLQHKTLHSRLDLVIEEYKSIQIEYAMFLLIYRAFGRIHSLMDDSPIDLVSDEEEDLSIIEKQS
ncbi:unnamed protein product [Protopolystoma xenopodis]|uniref:Uncharacterized protein n=1 Tax=Protopolystoma xenopodis TaxID=117903 RepID=A0A448X8C3_9PLAT|nr:unnamed protein product [Protopolystoma xenopodis]